MKHALLTTADDVIEALGGVTEVAALTGVSVQSACNWRAFRRFPARTYLLFKHALETRELTAPPELWGMAEAVPVGATSAKRATKSRSRPATASARRAAS